MRKELLRTLCVSALVVGGSTFIGTGFAVAQSSELTPIIINPEDVYELNAKKPGNIYSSTYQKRVDTLEQENQNLHKIIKTIKPDANGESSVEHKNGSDEVVKLKSDLYDFQRSNGELRSALEAATQKIEVLQKLVEKQQLNEKYLTHQLKNIDEKIDDRAEKKIEDLENQNKSLRITIKELYEATKSTNILAAIEPASGQKEPDVFFKREIVAAEDISSSVKIDERKDTNLSSLDLLSTDIDSKKIKYMRGDKEMISGTSDEAHMEEATVVETDYPPLEETLPRQSSFNN